MNLIRRPVDPHNCRRIHRVQTSHNTIETEPPTLRFFTFLLIPMLPAQHSTAQPARRDEDSELNRNLSICYLIAYGQFVGRTINTYQHLWEGNIVHPARYPHSISFGMSACYNIDILLWWNRCWETFTLRYDHKRSKLLCRMSLAS